MVAVAGVTVMAERLAEQGRFSKLVARLMKPYQIPTAQPLYAQRIPQAEQQLPPQVRQMEQPQQAQVHQVVVQQSKAHVVIMEW